MPLIFPPNAPKLPQFKSLVVKGAYHASAPLHFCLSVEEGCCVLITPCRSTFETALKEFNDSWLNDNGGNGFAASNLARTKIFYPPTPAHFAVLPSLLHYPQTSDAPYVNSKVVLETLPSYIVLHELSSYFTQDATRHTVSSYFGLVSEVMATATFLAKETGRDVKVVLFDSCLDQLKLPIVRLPPRTFSLVEEDEPAPRIVAISTVVEKYFDWVGDVQSEDDHCVLKLRGPGEQELQYDWALARHTNGSGRESKTFVFYLILLVCQIPRSSMAETDANTDSESFFEDILKPGSSFHPTFLAIVDGVLGVLLVGLLSLAVMTAGNIHLIFLTMIELGLWASVKWFVREWNKAQAEVAATSIQKDGAKDKKE